MTLTRLLLHHPGPTHTPPPIAAVTLDRFACHATGYDDEGTWRSVAGPPAAGLFDALAWAGSHRGRLLLEQPDPLPELRVCWDELLQRRWAVDMRLSLGLRDFEDAVGHLDFATLPPVLEPQQLHLDWMACRVRVAGVVVAPTLELAREVGAHALRAWVGGDRGLRDELVDGLPVRFARLQSQDGRITA